MVVEADEEDAAAKDMEDEEAREEVEKEIKQEAGWMMMNFMRCLLMHEPSTSKNVERKEKKSAQLVEKAATKKAATSQ